MPEMGRPGSDAMPTMTISVPLDTLRYMAALTARDTWKWHLSVFPEEFVR